MSTAGPGTTTKATGFQGNDKLLLGMVLGVVSFWLFAGTAGTVAPDILADINSGDTDYLSVPAMNLAVSVTALFSGMFIVVFGGFADKYGRVKVALIGNVLNILGSLLLVFAAGPWALPLLLVGRALQGLSAAAIMPSTMALLKTYWDGAGRQRAVSMWSIGSWGGSGLAAVFGGAVIQTLGSWRWIFVLAIVVSLLSIALMWGTPESRVVSAADKPADVPGILLLVVSMLSLMVVLIFGSQLGWTSPTVIILAVVAVAGIAALVAVERRVENPLIELTLFANLTFTGATISNFLLNGTIGLLLVSQQLLQIGGDMEPFEAGLLSLDYGVFIIAFIRVGEKLLQRFGPRKPMLWGSYLVAVAVILLLPTHLLLEQYAWLAVIAYCFFGLGLALYATPSTDAALTNLPQEKAGSGSGIYKMASSLGNAIGTAISLALFTAFSETLTGADYIGTVLDYEGRVDNVAVRAGGAIALGFNLLIVVLAIVTIMITIPKQMDEEKEDEEAST